MASRFVSAVAALALVSVAAANPFPYPHHHQRPACPKAALPEIHPTVVKSILPSPVNIGPQKAEYIEHSAYPYEINYFEKPYVVKHRQSAALNVYTQKPVIVDEYAKPSFNEQAGPQQVIVEEVYPAEYAEYAAEGSYAAPAASYAAPAGGCAPAVPVYTAPCH